jgi:hypothetical protein
MAPLLEGKSIGSDPKKNKELKKELKRELMI